MIIFEIKRKQIGARKHNTTVSKIHKFFELFNVIAFVRDTTNNSRLKLNPEKVFKKLRFRLFRHEFLFCF